MPSISRPNTPVILPHSQVSSLPAVATTNSVEHQTNDVIAPEISAPQNHSVFFSSGLRSPRAVSPPSTSYSPVGLPVFTDLSPGEPIVLASLKDVDVQDHGGVVKLRWSKHPNDPVLRQLGFEHDLINRYGVGLTPTQRTQLDITTCIQEIDSAQESLTLARSSLHFTNTQIREQPFMAFALRGMLPVWQQIINVQEEILAEVRPRLETLRTRLPTSSSFHAVLEVYSHS